MGHINPDNVEMVTVGRVIGVHGTAGVLKVRVLSDVPHRFAAGSLLELDGQPFRINSASSLAPQILALHLQGVTDRSAAAHLVDKWLKVPITASPTLPPGEYFHFQLLGLQVYTQEGEHLGEITEILETGSNDVYVVVSNNQEVLIPAIKSVIQDVDLDAHRMTVNLPAGLR